MELSSEAGDAPGASDYLMYAKTVQGCVLKVLLDSLNGLLVDASFQFSQEGVKLVELDNTHVVMLHLKLEARKFEEYHCEKPVSIGVNIGNLHTLLKTVNSNDTLTLFLEDGDRNRLGIRVENEEKRTKTEFKLNLLDLDTNEYNIPPVGFNSCIILPASFMQKVIRDMANLSDRVEIKNIGRQLILSCTGHFCNQETVLQDTEGDGDDEVDNSIKQGVFSLRYLTMFTKVSSLSANVEIFLKNSFPLIVKYNLALGILKLCLSPIQTDDGSY
jgi:proliferating cell nuclear antigen